MDIEIYERDLLRHLAKALQQLFFLYYKRSKNMEFVFSSMVELIFCKSTVGSLQQLRNLLMQVLLYISEV